MSNVDGVYEGDEMPAHEELYRETERLQAKLASCEAALEQAGRLLGIQTAEVERLRAFEQDIIAAHREHLRTGDYAALGMAVQDVLRNQRPTSEDEAE